MAVTPSEHVTALTYAAAAPSRLGVSVMLGHGAGAGQLSDFMVHFATGLASRGIDAITFDFVYTEQGRRLPDRNDKLEACYRKVIEAFHAGKLSKAGSRYKLVIGGKSMGGRIASQVAAGTPDGIAGVLLLGYPLHPPGRPGELRTKHLSALRVPMLVVQGARDTFGTPTELAPILRKLSAPADLYVVEGGDHSFKVAKRAAVSQEQVYAQVLDRIGYWIDQRLGTGLA